MEANIDKWSLLPEALLSTIVSSLPFKEAVRTSILSKHWVNVYKLTTNIEFNELFFVKFDQPPEIIEAQREAFWNFMKKWIESCEENVVDKFHLAVSVPLRFSPLINRCIQFAIRNRVKDLELDFTHPTWINDSHDFYFYVAVVNLPNYVYGYSGLESLKLYSCGFVASEMVNFHSLKEISLGFMKLRICAIKALLTNCKKLESLSFFKCWNPDDVFDLEIEYLGVKKLVMKRCEFKLHIFTANAPNLKVFIYNGLTIVFVDIQSPALEEVNLDFTIERRNQFKSFAGFYLYNLLRSVSSARIMTVCSYLLQVIYSTEGLSNPMNRSLNVKHLILKACLHKFEFMGITFMLNNCPNLEHLTIEIVDAIYLWDYEPTYNVIPERYWIDCAKDYKCVKSHLKEMEIKGFKGTKNEINMISYFLTCGKVLRKMSIYLLRDDMDGEDDGLNNVTARREAAELLLMVPKASTNLEISIY